MSRRLEVLLGDQPVGMLAERSDGGAEFRFFDSYRALVPRPVLGQKFEDDLARVYRNRKGERLPDFFANLIPEGRLRELIEKAVGLEPGDDLGLLAFVGRDLPGAVVVQPITEGTRWELSDSNAEPGEGEAEAWENGDEPPEIDESLAQARAGLRFSLAGVQLKFSMLLEDDKLTLPASDRTRDWIVKFDSLSFPRLPENEYSMLEWARRSGFDVPECHLHELDALAQVPRRYAPKGTRVLAVRRYDRLVAVRVHQEDFAQVVGLPPLKKDQQQTYERMANLVRGFLGDDAVEEFLCRLLFVIASGNNDAHLKNWSFVYPDGVHARWSPLYDQVATVAWESPDRALTFKLAGVQDFRRIDQAAVDRFAARAHLGAARNEELVAETLGRLRAVWRELAGDLPLPEEHREALRAHWRSVPLLQAAGPLD